MFWKKKKNAKKKALKVESENLAVPEIHIGEVRGEDDKGHAEAGAVGKKERITYDNVAIPEVHIRRKKN